MSKISGPLIDRIDLTVQVDPLNCELLLKQDEDNKINPQSETSAQIRARVEAARQIQAQRFNSDCITCNSQMTPAMVRKYCILSKDARELLLTAYNHFHFSARSNDKILKVARTIADLDKSNIITSVHISEAIQYNVFERLNRSI